MSFCVRATARVYRWNQLYRSTSLLSVRQQSASAQHAVQSTQQPMFDGESVSVPAPAPDGAMRQFDDKILNIVNDIAKLTLMEVSQLNDALKEKLNLPDAPVMSAGFAQPLPSADQAEADAPTAVKTSFTVKLVKYDDTKKIPLIKEIKATVQGLNLVQAKKFVESTSDGAQVVRADVGKDEAEKLKADLEKIGATCTID